MSFWKKRPTSCLQSQVMSLAEGIAFAVTYESMLLCDPNLPVYTHGGQRFETQHRGAREASPTKSLAREC